jgi:hypothetical protein
MSIFNFQKPATPKTITVDKHRAVLVGGRNPITGQPVLMAEADAQAHRAFINLKTAVENEAGEGSS